MCVVSVETMCVLYRMKRCVCCIKTNLFALYKNNFFVALYEKMRCKILIKKILMIHNFENFLLAKFLEFSEQKTIVTAAIELSKCLHERLKATTLANTPGPTLAYLMYKTPAHKPMWSHDMSLIDVTTSPLQ